MAVARRWSAELAHLESCLLSARRGEGRVILLAGPAGVGKTRLPSELVSDAGEQGVGLSQARCFDTDTSTAYAPLPELLGASPLRASEGLLRHPLLAHLRRYRMERH